MRKLGRTQLRSFTMQQLAKQGGKCPLCGLPIDASILREAVCDHDHETGEIRGVLHRSCNAAEGKVANAAGRWGAKSTSYAAVVPWLKNLIAYLEQPGTGLMYPTHKTDEEKRLERNKKARVARANSRARAQVRAMPKKEG